MNFSDISIIRLYSQHINNAEYIHPDDILKWMGAMQAQDLPMALLAIVLRTKINSVKLVEKAFNDGEIIRTHLMRPTWHIVSKKNIYWMLDLTVPALKRLSTGRNKQLELTDDIFNKSFRLLEKNLQGKELDRAEITKLLNNNGIKTDENRLSHMLAFAEFEQIVCNGSMKGRLQTYALLEEKVPEKIRFSREESILKLTETYFQSHAPATIADFAWWSGMNLKDIRWALDELKNKFENTKIEDEIYYFPSGLFEKKFEKPSICLLPAYDEFLVSYQSKQVSIPNPNLRKAVSVNGIFHPIIVENGQVIGTWKKISTKKNFEIETHFFKEKGLTLTNEINKLKQI